MSVEDRSIRKTPNDVLREERLRRGWTQQDVADRIGSSVVNVSRWERGATSPSPYFRQRLSSLFEKDAEALGLLPNIPGPTSDTHPLREEFAPPTPQEEPHEVSYPSREALTPLTPRQEPEEVAYRPARRRFSFWRSPFVVGMLIVFLALVVDRTFLISPLPMFPPPDGAKHLSKEIPPRPTPFLPKLIYSFEDGTTSGWRSAGHILSIQNSSEVGGYEGTHALQVIFSSRNGTDLPYISVNPHSDQPVSGQVLHAAIFVPQATSATVTASLYVQDSTYLWHSSHFTPLTTGKWQELQFPIPAFSGHALQVGIQFLSLPINTQTTVYVDAVAWG